MVIIIIIMHWQILYRFSPIKQVISYVFTNLYLPTLLHSFSPFQLLKPFPLPLHLPHLFYFFPSHHSHILKPYLQSKTFLNIRAVPSSAVFCRNDVLITAASSFVQFSSFLDVLSNSPTATGMTLMLLMFHTLSISLFSS